MYNEKSLMPLKLLSAVVVVSCLGFTSAAEASGDKTKKTEVHQLKDKPVVECTSSETFIVSGTPGTCFEITIGKHSTTIKGKSGVVVVNPPKS